MADPEIEKILDVKTDAKGNLSYFVKWEGYPDSDNTWETREDLIADGFGEDVKEADENLIGEPEYSANNAKRSRSKTPVRRKREPALVPDEAEADEDTEEVDDNVTGIGLESQEENDGGKEKEVSPTNYSSVDLPDAFWLVWLTMFLASIVFTIVFEMWITIMEGNKKKAQVGWTLYAARLSACLPALMFLVLVYYKAPNTAFANRVCAVQLWISTLTFFELVPKLLPKEESAAIDDLILFSLGMWQLLVFLSLSSSASRHSEYGFSTVTAILVLIGAVGLAYAQNLEGNPIGHELSVPQWVVLSIALVSTVHAFSLLFGVNERSFGTWLEFYGTLLSLMVVLLYIVREVGHVIVPVQIFDIGRNKSLTINVMWFLETLMRWFTCATFSYSAISHHQTA